MNIEQAKQIDIRLLAEHLGGRYHKQTKPTEIWYYSPFRPEEKKASFKINPQRNNWWDFARGEGGSTLDLWLDCNNQDRRNSDAIKTALQALRQFANQPLPLKRQYRIASKDIGTKTVAEREYSNRFKLLKICPRIWYPALLEEVGRRKLSLATVSPYVKQAYILDTKTKNRLTGFAFQNDADGWEISIPNPRNGKSFKTSIGRKAPTSFTRDMHETTLIFEGFWDYLTWIQMQKTHDLKADVYIMNSLSFKKQVVENILIRSNIGKILLFLDNDMAGKLTLHDIVLCLESNDFIIGSMNHIYTDSKDLSAYWSQNSSTEFQTVHKETNHCKLELSSRI